jgi:hypothetical protein
VASEKNRPWISEYAGLGNEIVGSNIGDAEHVMNPAERVLNSRMETIVINTDDTCDRRSRFLHPAYIAAFRPNNALINPARHTTEIGDAIIDMKLAMDPRLAPMRVFTVEPSQIPQVIREMVVRHLASNPG